MAFNFLSQVLAPAAPPEESVAETVDRLCERVTSATMLEDRRDAVRSLRSLSKDFQLEVGRSMDVLVTVLQHDRSDAEITRFALETLIAIMSRGEGGAQTPAAQLAVGFTEMFTKKAENVHLLLDLLEEHDFYVRYHTVQLLTVLLSNRSKELQECILSAQMGVSRLMDLLSDNREVVRNEGLLLLIQLTKENSQIQKIVTFENAFERLLEIIIDEGLGDGGIIIEDCLRLMHNLLRDMTNRKYFRETSCVQKLVPFFKNLVPPPPEPQPAGAPAARAPVQWPPQKVSNVRLMLELVRLLVPPNGSDVKPDQKALAQHSILGLLCDLGMTDRAPTLVRTDALNAIAEIVRGHGPNQALLFAHRTRTAAEAQPAVYWLLHAMLEAQRPFEERCACLYAFRATTVGNTELQGTLVSAIANPGSASDHLRSFGPILCGGLFAMNETGGSNWFASLALSSLLDGNQQAKEAALRVALALRLGEKAVPLLHQCLLAAQQLAQTSSSGSAASSVRSRVGLLRLLCGWCADCPTATRALLQLGPALPFLVENASHHTVQSTDGAGVAHGLSTLLLGICAANADDANPQLGKAAIRQIIVHRIGLDNFTSQLNALEKTDAFVRASQHAHLSPLPDRGADAVLLDREFVANFRDQSYAIDRMVRGLPPLQNTPTAAEHAPSPQAAPAHAPGTPQQAGGLAAAAAGPRPGTPDVTAGATAAHAEDLGVVASYKELIRKQDQDIAQLKRVVAELQGTVQRVQAERDAHAATIERQRAHIEMGAQAAQQQQQIIDSLRANGGADAHAAQAPAAAPQVQPDETSARRVRELENELNELRAKHSLLETEQEDLLMLMAEQDIEAKKLKARLRALGEDVPDDDEGEGEEDDADGDA